MYNANGSTQISFVIWSFLIYLEVLTHVLLVVADHCYVSCTSLPAQTCPRPSTPSSMFAELHSTVFFITKASYLPISIVIVGVGPADFSSECPCCEVADAPGMRALDGDDGALKIGSKKPRRDIVQVMKRSLLFSHFQFVPFRDFQGKDPALLSRVWSCLSFDPFIAPGSAC